MVRHTRFPFPSHVSRQNNATIWASKCVHCVLFLFDPYTLELPYFKLFRSGSEWGGLEGMGYGGTLTCHTICEVRGIWLVTFIYADMVLN